MEMHRRRSRAIQFEFMERRETPSGVAGAADIVEGMRFDSRATQFQLIASGISISQITPPDGPTTMLALLKGQATLLGQFHGQLMVEHTQGQNTGIAVAYLVGDHGATLSLTIEALGSGGAGNGDQPQPSIRGRYWITGGAGAMAGATGAGTIGVFTNPDNGDFTIEMRGQIAF
jgi:hypothetical protein